MDKIAELKQKLTDASEEMKSMNALCEKEDRGFTEEEQAKYDELDKSLDSIDEEIKTEEKAAQDRIDRAAQAKARQDKLDTVNDRINNITIPTPVIQAVEPEDFKSLNEFIDAVLNKMLFKRNDNRLAPLYTATMSNPEFRSDQSFQEGTAGGYMVPTQWRPDIMKVAIQQSIFRSRCTVLPAGSPPDAEVTLPALNQASSVNGGVDIVWVKEGDTKTQTDWVLKEVSLIPHECAGFVVLTDKLIRNWSAAVSFTESRLTDAVVIAEDTAFLTGNGVAKPKGILTQNCAITQARNTAGSIVFADIRNMFWKVLQRGPNASTPVWIASPSVIPQLLALADPGTAGTMIFLPNAREGMPMTLLGWPLIINERSPALASKGDLILANLGYYLIKDGSGPFVAASEHVYFTSNRTVVKIFFNVDGDSWMQDKFPIEGDAANFLSPFVILDA